MSDKHDQKPESKPEAPEPQALPTVPSGLMPLHQGMSDRLKQRIGALVQGGAKDVERFAVAMSVDFTLAAAEGDERALRHLAAQAKNLGEKHRLAASKAAWASIGELGYDLAFIASRALLGA